MNAAKIMVFDDYTSCCDLNAVWIAPTIRTDDKHSRHCPESILKPFPKLSVGFW